MEFDNAQIFVIFLYFMLIGFALVFAWISDYEITLFGKKKKNKKVVWNNKKKDEKVIWYKEKKKKKKNKK